MIQHTPEPWRVNFAVASARNLVAKLIGDRR
jgi:hypothetical protein